MSRATKLLRQLEDEGAGQLAADRLQSLLDLLAVADELHTEFQWGREADEIVEASAPAVDDGTILYRLGNLVEVGYLTQKGSDPPTIYEHTFSRPIPTLAATTDGGLVIAGGRYRVTSRGIVG